MNMSLVESNVEKVLQRLAAGKSNARPEQLIHATAGDDALLGDTLWSLVRQGKAALIGQDRLFVRMLEAGTFDAHDFLTLLRQLKGANLPWFEGWKEHVDGLAYHGWSKELEMLLDKLLATPGDRTPLEWADVSEPAGSSLLFALGRRGLVDAAALPPDALHRFAWAFLWRGGWCPEQFAGWDRLWEASTFARAAFACVNDVIDVGSFPDEIEPLVQYASPSQLAVLVDKMIWPDTRVIRWMAARGKAIVPQLTVRCEELLRDAKKGEWFDDEVGWHVGALARIRAENKEPWPTSWIPLAKGMLEHDSPGLLDVLRIVDPQLREKWLLDHVANKENWDDNLRPLREFASPRLVDRVVEVIRKTPKGGEWHDDRLPLFKTLAKMGVAGQTALEMLVHEPDQTELALEHLTPNLVNLPAMLDLFRSADPAIRFAIGQCCYRLGNEERILLVERHFDALPPAFVAHLLGHTHFHVRTAELAARLPDNEDTHVWREFCLHPPEALRALMHEMASTPQDAIERARIAMNRELIAAQGGKPDEDDDDEDDDEGFQDRLRRFGPEDLPAILQVTACRMNGRFGTVRDLCAHFWPARPEIPWVAAFWWGIDSGSCVKSAASVVGSAIMPALHARAESGTFKDTDWHELIPVFTQFDPVKGFRYCLPWFENSLMRLTVEHATQAAIEQGSQEARDWLIAALSTKAREFALYFLRRHAVPETMPALLVLEKQKLPAKLKKLVPEVIEVQKTCGATLESAHQELLVHPVCNVGAAIESLRVSQDGKTLAVQTAGTVTVWQDTRITTIQNVGVAPVELSLDGRFVVVATQDGVKVFDPWSNTDQPLRILRTPHLPRTIVPMPKGRVMTLSVAPDAVVAPILWDLETGTYEVHKWNGVPAQAVWLNDTSYVAATADERITLRNLDGGKSTGKLQTWEGHAGGGICGLGSGAEGKLVAVVFFDGSLMIFDISGEKVKALGRHSRVAPRALATDPLSSWVVTPGRDEVLVWKAGQPVRSLAGSGALAVPREEPFDQAGMAVFVRPHVVAVGGQTVDIWDLETSQHLGRWDKPVTAMAAASGQLFVGDAQGGVWRVKTS